MPQSIEAGWRKALSATDVMSYQGVDRVPIVLSLACHSAGWATDNLKRTAIMTGSKDVMELLKKQTSTLPIDASQPNCGGATPKSQAGAIAYYGSEDLGGVAVYFCYDRGKLVPYKIVNTPVIMYHKHPSRSFFVFRLGRLLREVDGVTRSDL